MCIVSKFSKCSTKFTWFLFSDRKTDTDLQKSELRCISLPVSRFRAFRIEDPRQRVVEDSRCNFFFALSVYPSAKASLNSTSPRLPKHSTDAPRELNDCASVNINENNNNNNNNLVISAYAGPMMEKEAMTYRMRLCRPFRNSVRQLIVSRNSPIRTMKKKEDVSLTLSSASTVSTTSTHSNVRHSTNDGSSGDMQRPLPSLSSKNVLHTADNVGKNADGSGEIFPLTRNSDPIVEESSLADSLVSRGSGESPPHPASTDATKRNNFATPVKVTTPWSVGSAARSIGSADLLQRFVSRKQCRRFE